MNTEITIISSNLEDLKLGLQFGGPSNITVSSFKILDDNTLVMYWFKEKGNILLTPLTGVEIFPMLQHYLNTTEITTPEMEGDGSNYKGYEFTTNLFKERYMNIPDINYVAFILKPVWIYYGK